MINFLSHIFLPAESNNYRAKLLHHNVLILFIAVVFTSSLLFDALKSTLPSVLGIQTNITVEQLVALTNQKRAESGLSPLTLNDQLSNAASLKAADMLEKDYWAHNSPDGNTPWVFIKQAGYSYTYAGENLAKGFNSAEEVVNAWMESPKHRDNMLFKNYSDVGFSVVSGKLGGQDTVLIVQELGDQAGRPIASSETSQPTPLPEPQITQTLVTAKSDSTPAAASTPDTAVGVFATSETNQRPILNSLSFPLNIDKALVAFFIFVFILDMIVVERKRIVRLVGHNTDHIFFLVAVFLFIVVLGRGVIL